jgi:beta-lactamase class A
MGIRALAAGSAVLATGIMAIGTSGVTAASVTKPAIRAGRASAASAARGGQTSTAPTTGTATAASIISPDARVREGICTSPPAYRALAARMSADIQGALRGRAGNHAVTVYDTVTEVSCYTDSERQFDSASIVKAIILPALLRWHQETGTPLSSEERDEATLMITQSDNDAATELWNEVGMSRLQHFLNLAKMGETQLDQNGYWGLTQVTAHDEMLLLQLLTLPNSVLSASSRSYQLGLMARVISSQRWGTPAGAPSGVTVHVKNGWLPDDTGWHINSIGAFTGKNKNYLIAVLTDDNPSEQYGIDTIQAVARVVHRDLNEARQIVKARLAANVAPSSSPAPPALAGSAWAWAVVPALPTPPPAP